MKGRLVRHEHEKLGFGLTMDEWVTVAGARLCHVCRRLCAETDPYCPYCGQRWPERPEGVTHEHAR